MEKAKKKKEVAVKLGAIVLAYFVLFGAIATSIKAFAWDFHGIDMSNVDSVDLYFLDMTLSSESVYIKNSDSQSYGSMPLPDWWNRADADALFKFTFPNLVYTEKDMGKTQAVFLMQTFTVNCPEGQSLWVPFIDCRFDFQSKKLTFSLSNNYYKWLAAMSQNELNLCFKDFTIDLLHSEKGNHYINKLWDKPNKKYGFNATIGLRSEASDPGVLNPDDDNFDLDAGNNGSNLQPPPPDGDNGSTGFGFFQWLAGLFGQPVSAVMTILLIAVGVIGVIFLIKFLKWAFK